MLSGHCNDHAGKRFGSLTVIEPVGRSKNNTIKWRCVCDCGGEIVAYSSALTSKTHPTISCVSCKRKRQAASKSIHGHTSRRNAPAHGTGTYKSWRAMRQRCEYPGTNSYENYGGRGIRVCDRWRESFEAFLEDMGERPEGSSLDRIDSDKDYEPGNCRWATSKEQSENRSVTHWIEFRGEKMTLSEFARRVGIDRRLVRHRIVKLGLTVEEVAMGIKNNIATVTKSGGVSTVSGALS